MSNAISITCEKRELAGTANARRMRRAGQIPAVVYGHGLETRSIFVTKAELDKLAGHNGMVELTCSCGDSQLAIIKEVQRHPISNQILHIDFLGVKADETIDVVIPLHLNGEPVGLRQGGQLEQVIHELTVECLPANVPEVLDADVSGLELDQALRVADLQLPAGVKVKNDAEEILAHVRLPHVAAAAAEEAPAASDEAAADAEKADKGEKADKA